MMTSAIQQRAKVLVVDHDHLMGALRSAHCHFGLVTLNQKVGRNEQAQAELQTAAQLYQQMGMNCWLEKAGAPLAAVRTV
jgi:hypothetical protein